MCCEKQRWAMGRDLSYRYSEAFCGDYRIHDVYEEYRMEERSHMCLVVEFCHGILLWRNYYGTLVYNPSPYINICIERERERDMIHIIIIIMEPFQSLLYCFRTILGTFFTRFIVLIFNVKLDNCVVFSHTLWQIRIDTFQTP